MSEMRHRSPVSTASWPRAALCVTVALSLALIAFTSVLYIAERTQHDCRGGSCPVCLHLEAAHSALTSPGDQASAASASLTAPAILSGVALDLRPGAPRASETPITLKDLILI